MKLALRGAIKVLNAVSASLEELRYEAGSYKDKLHNINRQILAVREQLQEIVEAL